MYCFFRLKLMIRNTRGRCGKVTRDAIRLDPSQVGALRIPLDMALFAHLFLVECPLGRARIGRRAWCGATGIGGISRSEHRDGLARAYDEPCEYECVKDEPCACGVTRRVSDPRSQKVARRTKGHGQGQKYPKKYQQYLHLIFPYKNIWRFKTNGEQHHRRSHRDSVL